MVNFIFKSVLNLLMKYSTGHGAALANILVVSPVAAGVYIVKIVIIHLSLNFENNFTISTTC